jgi:hypothetical protein
MVGPEEIYRRGAEYAEEDILAKKKRELCEL